MDGDRVNISAPIGEAQTARWPAIDVARGAALAAMIIYHLTWDLSFFRYIGPHVATSPGWALFAKSIAASFLFLSGVSFALASRTGINRRAFSRRLVMITAAALAVSLGTAYAMPQAPVLFGILHCLAASSVVMLFAARLPAWALFLAALACLSAPAFFSSPHFDGPSFAWLGLNITPLTAVDHVPMLPWCGWALLGLAVMRLFLTHDATRNLRQKLMDWRGQSVFSRALIFSGRHSLAVYLLHQPLLMGLLWLGAPAPDHTSGFRDACTATCLTARADAPYCQRYCTCMTRALSARPIWTNIVRNALTAEEKREAEALADQCQKSP